jgi:D-aspartate ligase
MNFVPVIFGGYVNGYSLARTFYETYNIESIICDISKNIAYYSKFCKFFIIKNPNNDIDAFINDVIKIGRSVRDLSKFPILLVTNDIWLIPLAKYKKKLENIFLYSFSGWDVIDKFVNKNKLYKLSFSLGISYPKTVCVNRSRRLDFDIQQLQFPLLVKPSDVNEYSYCFPGYKRNFVFETIDAILNHLRFVYENNYSGDLILQEYIPGGVENLFTCTTYSDRTGKVLAASTGCKLSQFPVEAGTITSGLVKHNKYIIEFTRILLESNSFFGIANTEFKYDTRNNTYKLIEINARPGMWNYSVFLSGINLIKYLIDDIVYKKPLSYSETRENLIWSLIAKREIKKNYENYENKLLVSKLLEDGKVFYPLRNKNDGFIFKLRYFFLLFRRF